MEALHFAQEHMAPLVVDQEEQGDTTEKSIQSTPTKTPESTPLRNRAVSLGASPRTPSSAIDFSAIRPSFILPFSFPANPLAFLTPRSEARSPNETQLTRENRSMTIGCDTPTTIGASSSEQLISSTSNPKGSADYSTLPLTVEDQSTYIKEAMCHLMSMLAFGTQGQNGGGKSQNNVVPQLYQPECRELRLRLGQSLFLLNFADIWSTSFTMKFGECIGEL